MAKGIHRLLEERFGVRVRPSEDLEATSIGTSSTRILRDNPMRLGFVIVNLSANVVYLRPRRAASTTTGIRLGPNGGSLTVEMNDDFTLPGVDWHAIADGASSTIWGVSLIEEPGEREAES